jgi:competence protein ComEC
MKQPLLSVVVLLIAGIALGNQVELPVHTLLVAGLIAGIAAFLLDRIRKWLLPVILVLAGAANVSLHRQIISPIDVRTVLPATDELVTIQGTVIKVSQKPVLQNSADKPPRYSVQIQLNHVRPNRAEWRQVHGKLIASVEFDGAENILPGQTIQLFGVLSAPPGPFAPRMFDYRAHLADRGIYFLLRSEETTDLIILKSTRVPLVFGFQKWAMAALGKGFPPDDPSIELLWAMCLGWRTGLSETVSEPFMKSGTMHLFAISGLHVALIAGILIALLRFVRISRAWSGLIVIPMLWFFTAATGWQASAIRSSIMMSVILFAWSLRRPTDLINTLSAAALIILLWDPTQLFQAGFQLSFAVVGTIALALPTIEKCRQTIPMADPFLPVQLRPKWKQWLDPLLNFGVTAFLISLAAWIGSLPLIMVYFNLLTPVSLLANVIVIQLAALALASASGCLICAPFVPVLAELFNHSAWFFMTLMIHVSEWFSELPLAWSYTKAPPLTAIVCHYSGVIALLTSPDWLPRSARRMTAALSGAIIAVMLWSQNHSRTQLTLLPLRGGLAVFVENLVDQNWLIDCGDTMNYEHRTREFLKTRGVNRIDNFFTTHADVRHLGAATNLIAEFRPERIFLNPIARNAGSYHAMADFIEEHHLKCKLIQSGEEIGPWLVLHPAADDQFGKADAGTLVMLLHLGDETILLCGDLNSEGQQILMDRHPKLNADTVVVSPNSDGRPVHPEWLAQLRPKTVIIADSVSPVRERASDPYVDRLRNSFDTVRIMSREGTLSLQSEPEE